MSLNFSKEQRVILINQFEILKHLDPSYSDYYDNKIEILHNGYSYFYDDIVGDLSEDFPKETSRTVLDIFELYRKLYFSYKRLSPEDQEQINERDVIFKGFDGNTETSYYSFANFVVLRAGKYGEIKDLIEEGKVDMNSHSSRINYYIDLLSRWSPLRQESLGKDLTLQQIKHLLNK
ncbi:YfbU family protein [Bacillus sp. S34]|nr:YfbU family protein [Bacillus sp. S34]